jgi:transcriptional regulator GlxA family with amidase domain
MPDAIAKAITLLDDYRNLSIAEIADKCAVSETYLRKSFKKYLNISPNEYRIKTRIEKAKNLLLNSEMSVKEITYLLGFYDEAYFYKIFKSNEYVIRAVVLLKSQRKRS